MTTIRAIDLITCDAEPIHSPGSIQPHGILLVVDMVGLDVRQGAGDIERCLGVVGWVDQPLNVLIGDDLTAAVAALSEPGTGSGFMGQFQAATGEMLDVSAYLSTPYILVELESASPGGTSASSMMDSLANAAAGFERTPSLATLCEKAAIEFRRLTGFDRVMVYRFLDHDVGMVFAEDRREGLRSFLNHHFPASDIPRQARALYLRNLIRVIPDARYQPLPLRPGWAAPEPLDMSDSALRSVSPVHLRYLANMGVVASASVSIVKDGALWGLVACHNETPRHLTFDVRAACRSLAGSLARQIKAKEEADGYRQRIRLRGFEDDLIRLLSRDGSLSETLANHMGEMGRMMGADGMAVLRGAELLTTGVCPGGGDIRDLAKWLISRTDRTIVATDCLSDLYAPARYFSHTGSGLMSVIMSIDEPWLLLWFRVEQVVTVNWAGNPHQSVTDPGGELTPRGSFDAWEETVRGRARGWSLPEIDAAKRLQVTLLDAQKTRRVHKLNRQLTGLLRDKDVLLAQKEFLTGEVNHRVQNSLQLVSSFLILQSRKSKSAEVHAALEEAGRRLNAVALVHRRLYRGDQVHVVDAGRYIEELCADTLVFMGADWGRHLTLDLSPVMISTDQAVPLGLVLTELMINANKYAYAGGAGPLEIQLIENRTHFHMAVADKGVGKAAAVNGFGSRVVEGLVAQLKGELTLTDNRPGLRTTIRVPIQKAELTVAA